MYIPTDTGEWVSEDHERLARMIQEYDSNYVLRYIPPRYRTSEDTLPYCVVDTSSFPERAVLYASELEDPTTILGRIFAGDNKHGDVLARMDAHNKAIEATKYKQQMDQYDEQARQAHFLLTSPLNYLNFNGKKLGSNRKEVL